MLIDTFHARASGSDPSDWVTRHDSVVGHVHVADFPGRHEPGTGSTNFSAFLGALSEAGYSGAIGFEYRPANGTGLIWIEDWQPRHALRPHSKR